jgi:hypothetical protein
VFDFEGIFLEAFGDIPFVFFVDGTFVDGTSVGGTSVGISVDGTFDESSVNFNMVGISSFYKIK